LITDLHREISKSPNSKISKLTTFVVCAFVGKYSAIRSYFNYPQGWKKWSKKGVFYQVMRPKKARFASLSTTCIFALQKIDLPGLPKLTKAFEVKC